MTRFEFTSKDTLWQKESKYAYLPPANFGKTGMTRSRWQGLFSCVRFSAQPPSCPPNMSSEKYRWMLVDDFVTNINNHCSRMFTPSSTICVDESMCRWYGHGGKHINKGLPRYTKIDCKPEDGAEIQNAACAESGVMIQLKLLKNKRSDVETHASEDAGLPHGAKVLKELLTPWFYSN
jgi:Transposase IS4